jgi:PII-like signaling protein
MIPTPQKMLLMFMDETDMWREERLYSALVRILERNGLAGVTVLAGIMGYGIHRRIHHKGLFGVTDEKPITMIVIDNEEKIRSILPIVVPMVREGLITLLDTEVISTGSAEGGIHPRS